MQAHQVQPGQYQKTKSSSLPTLRRSANLSIIFRYIYKTKSREKNATVRKQSNTRDAASSSAESQPASDSLEDGSSNVQAEQEQKLKEHNKALLIFNREQAKKKYVS